MIQEISFDELRDIQQQLTAIAENVKTSVDMIDGLTDSLPAHSQWMTTNAIPRLETWSDRLRRACAAVKRKHERESKKSSEAPKKPRTKGQ